MAEVLVAGGGLAGLVAARRLAADHDVVLFERRDRPGGRVRSDRESGFVLDRGFQVLFSSYAAVEEELDLEALSLCPFKPGATLARPGKRTTVADPFGDLSVALATVVNRDITFGDKLRVLLLRRELLRKPLDDVLAADGESIESYLESRGFSRRFRERFAAPFYGGITLDRSLETSRLVFEYTFKMLAQGTAAVPADGMGAITDQLAARARDVGVAVETGTEVSSLTMAEDGVQVRAGGETVRPDGVVVATDPKQAETLTGCTDVPTAGQGCVTQYFSLPETQQLPGSRRLVLNVADARPNQIAVLSAVAPGYAPAGEQLLSATFLGEQEASDEQLASEVRETLADWYPENRFGELELLRTDRIEFAQFTQPPGFRGSLPSVDQPDGPVVLAGEYTEWSSIQGAIRSGQRAARELDAEVGR